MTHITMVRIWDRETMENMLIRQMTIAFNVKLQDIASLFCGSHVLGGKLVDIFGSHLEKEGD